MPFYAVHKGRTKGVFCTWKECQKSVEGYKGAVFKKFSKIEDAEYFAKYGKIQEIQEIEISEIPKYLENKFDIIVFTDGACRNNGKSKSKAGMGIYFGENDERNVSKRISGKQTNNTAELKAIIEVSDILKTELSDRKKVLICSDSKYSINCCTKYGKKQENDNWSNEIPNKYLVKKAHNIYKNYPNVEFKYVKGHSSGLDFYSIGNRNADKLATDSVK